VNDLKNEQGDAINFETASMTAEGVREKVTKAGLKTHGIIATNAAGEIVTTVEGHSYAKDKVLEVVELLTEP
tara:strand:- start:1344 stop:1559 length:216 start_codon:yes stop_codon:yes gene_type:complete